MQGPERIETARLLLRKPALGDAEAIFWRYASDPEVTRYLTWPTHRSVADTRMFLRFCVAEWERWPAGPYLIESKADHQVLGSTGLAFETPTLAATGYVLSRDSWGQGFATEALGAMVKLAGDLGIRQLSALCHPANAASARVLEKSGFIRESLSVRKAEFPNLRSGEPEDCLRYRLNV